jgi:hypothetical protein
MSDEKRRTELPVVSGQAEPDRGDMDRRHALKIMAIAAAAPAIAPGRAEGQVPQDAPAASPEPSGGLPQQEGSGPRGDAWDPDLLDPVVPWDRSLTPDELASLAVLCDVIIPEDERSPAASTVGAHDFIDEWVSAPYDGNRRDKVLVRGGLVWLDGESVRRFGAGLRFRDLNQAQKHGICDDISRSAPAAPGFEAASAFFDKVRDLTATAFYTSEEGMRDIQYVGNVPLAAWDPPPPEVLRHLGLA